MDEEKKLPQEADVTPAENAPTDAPDTENSPAEAPEPAPSEMEQMRGMLQRLTEMAEAAQPKEPTEEEKQAAIKARKLKARRRRRRALRDLLIRTLLLIAVVYVLFFHIVGLTLMPSEDMYPRVDMGDMVLYYRLDKDVRSQDIIVLLKDSATLGQRTSTDGEETEEETADVYVPSSVALAEEETPADDSLKGKLKRALHSLAAWLKISQPEGKQMFICRVVATAGDTVEVTDDGRLIVNGNSLIESNIFSPTTPYVGFTEYPLTLHAGECFVMADHRNGGADSRFFGPVLVEEIQGTVITIMRRNNL